MCVSLKIVSQNITLSVHICGLGGTYTQIWGENGKYRGLHTFRGFSYEPYTLEKATDRLCRWMRNIISTARQHAEHERCAGCISFANKAF
jgi:hypothetical protein